VRSVLGLPPSLSRDEVFSLLDAAGETSGAPLLLCIDGLNESRPRSYWRQQLAEFAGQVARFRWIRLVLTCRSTYADLVLPSHLDALSVTHHGFRGMEFRASAAYFAHYHLDPPSAPILQPEFENPLFLRLICEAMQTAGLRRLPAGQQGIYTAVRTLMQAKNVAYAQEFELKRNTCLPAAGSLLGGRGRRD
jgi:hypothetical protein